MTIGKLSRCVPKARKGGLIMYIVDELNTAKPFVALCKDFVDSVLELPQDLPLKRTDSQQSTLTYKKSQEVMNKWMMVY